MINIFLPIDPPTATAQQQKTRVVRQGNKNIVMKYDPLNVKLAKKELHDALSPYRPEEPMRGPVRLAVAWLFPAKKGAGHKAGDYRITRPDLDNLNKGLADTMTKLGFWNDDSQIAWLMCYKKWVSPEKMGLHILAEELPLNEDEETPPWE